MSVEAKARKVMRLLEPHASDVLLVGGFVRDKLLGLESKDVDIEVYGMDYDAIVRVLRRAGYRPNIVGRQFGVVNVDNVLDVSVPRRENKVGKGHRGFNVAPDPSMSPREAASRRDFTMNSMAMRLDGEILDYHGGREDLANRLLRKVSSAFSEDPLRVLRGMQLAARLPRRPDLGRGARMEEATVQACREMLEEYDALAPERIWGEWRKLLVKGRDITAGLTVLKDTGWLTKYPGLAALVGCPQDPGWHPEGDVWIHTLLTTDAAAAIGDREGLDEEDRMVLVLAMGCHDLGKPAVTEKNDEGRWWCPDHAPRGAAPAESFMASIGVPDRIQGRVLPLVRNHMWSLSFKDTMPSDRAICRLANRLKGVSIRMLARVVEADCFGRPTTAGREKIEAVVARAEALQVSEKPLEPILKGRHLIARGLEPGKRFGPILEAALDAQVDREFSDLDGALAWLEAYLEEHPTEN